MIGNARPTTRTKPDARVADLLRWVFENAAGPDATLAYETCAEYLRGNSYFVAAGEAELRKLALEHTDLMAPRRTKRREAR